MTPHEHYQQALASKNFRYDPAQEQVVQHLQTLYDALQSTAPLTATGQQSKQSWWARWLGRPRWPACRGLYLWGGVGRGKTWLVDAFCEGLPFEQKLRLHFHRFMKRIHQELEVRQGQKDPLVLVARQLASEARVICLDECFVTDITDAMLLGRLLEELFRQGVTLVVTSNSRPDDLYRDGLQRRKFLPAIALLNRELQVVNVDGKDDHRLRLLKQASLYHYPLNEAAEQALQSSFLKLAGLEELPEATSINVEGRAIGVRAVSHDVVWFRFDELCNTPRSQYDYIELAREFQSVLLSGVPQMGRSCDDAARRFISLVDEFYDHGVKLIISSEVPLLELYTTGTLNFAFERTLSRLQEMQSQDYLGQNHH